MTNLVIEATGLTKQYGSRRGIVDVGFGVAEGEAFGFLGPNGAGKTTTIRLLLGFLRPTGGSARLFGRRRLRRRGRGIHRNVAYLGSDPGFLGELTGAQQLDYLAELRGLPRRALERARRAPGAGPHRPDPQAVPRQPPEDRRRGGVHGPRAAAGPRRAHQRPRPAHAARVPRPARGGPRGGPHRLPLQPQPRRGRARLRSRRDHPRGPHRGDQQRRRAPGLALALDQPRAGGARPRRPTSTCRTSRSRRSPAARSTSWSAATSTRCWRGSPPTEVADIAITTPDVEDLFLRQYRADARRGGAGMTAFRLELRRNRTLTIWLARLHGRVRRDHRGLMYPIMVENDALFEAVHGDLPPGVPGRLRHDRFPVGPGRVLHHLHRVLAVADHGRRRRAAARARAWPRTSTAGSWTCPWPRPCRGSGTSPPRSSARPSPWRCSRSRRSAASG